MRVLFVDTPLDPPGGGQISLLTLLRAFGKMGLSLEFEVVLSTRGRFCNLLDEAKIPYKVVPPKALPYVFWRFKPDIVHCNSATTRYSFFSALLSKLLGAPFVWHNRVVERGGWKEKLIAVLSDRIIVPSKYAGGKFEWIKEKVRVIPNAVDINLFAPGKRDEKLAKSLHIAGKRVVGTFTRLEVGKGLLLLVDALLSMRKRGVENFVFLLGGDGKDKETVLKRAKELDLRYVGVVPYFNLPKFINLCDVVVFPSVLPESFGRLIVEAMACARAVVATDIGPVREIIDDRKDGILVEPTSSKLAEAIELLFLNGKVREELGRRARQKAVKLFSSKKHAKAIFDVYLELVGVGD